jgi:cold shock CspA family protein
MRSRAVGVVERWDVRKRFGWIRTLDQTYFAHVNDVVDLGASPTPGDFVEFLPAENERGLRAAHIRRLGPLCPKCSATLHGLRCDCGHLLGT